MELGNVFIRGDWLRMPVLTAAERDALASPQAAYTIYNSTAQRLEVFDGTVWAPPKQDPLVADDVPSIPISKVTGLTDALSSKVPVTYTQGSPATVWGPITNPYGRPCSVEVIDSAGNEIEAEVVHDLAWGSLTVRLNNQMAGTAVLY